MTKEWRSIPSKFCLGLQGKDQKRVCFIDRGVYTKNRAFRLMLSSKAGKSTILQPTGQHPQTLDKSIVTEYITSRGSSK